MCCPLRSLFSSYPSFQGRSRLSRPNAKRASLDPEPEKTVGKWERSRTYAAIFFWRLFIFHTKDDIEEDENGGSQNFKQ